VGQNRGVPVTWTLDTWTANQHQVLSEMINTCKWHADGHLHVTGLRWSCSHCMLHVHE